MRRTEFDRLVVGEFGDSFGSWIAGSHVLTGLGATASELIAGGADLREVWWALCEDFEVPEGRRLGSDE
ncbi:DUF3046 domain-containing protein [Corynebacterium terpenotabidum]|nr:DUF3046 domain-containing protein [Corynebacterium terpenotabidum]